MAIYLLIYIILIHITGTLLASILSVFWFFEKMYKKTETLQYVWYETLNKILTNCLKHNIIYDLFYLELVQFGSI